MTAMAIKISGFSGTEVSEGFESIEIIDFHPGCQSSLWAGNTPFRGLAVTQISWHNNRTRRGEICAPEWADNLPPSLKEELAAFVAAPKAY